MNVNGFSYLKSYIFNCSSFPKLKKKHKMNGGWSQLATSATETACGAKFPAGSNQWDSAGSDNTGDPWQIHQRTGLLQCVLSPRGQPQNWVKSMEIFCLLAVGCGWSHESGFLEAGRSTSGLGWGSWKARAWVWKDKLHLLSVSLLKLY